MSLEKPPWDYYRDRPVGTAVDPARREGLKRLRNDLLIDVAAELQLKIDECAKLTAENAILTARVRILECKLLKRSVVPTVVLRPEQQRGDSAATELDGGPIAATSGPDATSLQGT